MCRIAFFPAFFPREEAIEILTKMLGKNVDGIGSAYVKNGEFVIEKYPTSLDVILKRGVPFLNHFPYNGSTIVHLRAGSHGKNALRNTHPFIVGNNAIIHNGVFSSYKLLGLTMKKLGVKIKGETDTEIAANLYNILGPKEFNDVLPTLSGVFMALHKKTGTLNIIKSSGDLKICDLGNKVTLIASELDYLKYKNEFGMPGWYVFNQKGEKVKFEAKKFESTYPDWSNRGYGYGSSYGSESYHGTYKPNQLVDYAEEYQRLIEM